MTNLRTYQNYLLLFAIAFKTLILGTMLTLATHNICLGQLLNDDINWTQIVGTKRKRNDDPPQLSSFNHTAVIPETSAWLRRNLMFPVLVFIWRTCFSRHHIPGSRLATPLLRYPPDKIFIRNCAIVR